MAKKLDKSLVHQSAMETQFGKLVISEDGEGICEAIFYRDGLPEDFQDEETELLREAKRQLAEYFEGNRKQFELPLSLHGTQFQVEDWKALCTIPYGETRSYGEIARQIGRPKAFRAVGMANHNNPVSIIVPCHRVIGSDGSLVGYGGGLDIKKYLLDLEINNKNLEEKVKD